MLPLPRLTVPAHLHLRRAQPANARLALRLIERGVLPDTPADPRKDVPTLIEDALVARLQRSLPPRLVEDERLHLGLHLSKPHPDEPHVLVTFHVYEPVPYDMTPLLQRLDALDARLAPNLLAQLDTALELLPVFTPTAAYDVLVQWHWQGEDEPEELYWEARQELAHLREVHSDTLSEEEVRAFANQNYLTPDNIAGRLPKRLYRPDPQLDTTQMLAIATHQAEQGTLLPTPTDTWLVDALRQIQRLQALEPTWRKDENAQAAWDLLSYESLTPPMALVAHQGEAVADDLMVELFQDLERLAMEAGDYGPISAYLLDPSEDAALDALARHLETVEQRLALEAHLVTHLEGVQP